jgi:hypothetical protein
METTLVNEQTKTVGDPCVEYESIAETWKKSRAILGGQSKTKAHDAYIDVNMFKNILIPFSPTMSPTQYEFYKAEAELPGLTSQYAKILVGGLLRKSPSLNLPPNVPGDAEDWLRNSFGADGNSLISFLDEALWEELQTSRAWIGVDYPSVSEADIADMTLEERKLLAPYAVLHKAENIINWRRGRSNSSRANQLIKFTTRGYKEVITDGSHHPDLIETVTDQYLDASGYLVIDVYECDNKSGTVKVTAGSVQANTEVNRNKWNKVSTFYPQISNERFNFIPAYPLNGSIGIVDPILQPLVDREVALYNKVSRRNHLLYGAATYTPVVASDMSDSKFEKIVSSGLGSWLHVDKGDTVTALQTPTDALSDMEKAIDASVNEMSRMGIRMLSPEGSSGESGVSLEIRNAGQTAQLGLLNNKISNSMKLVIALMLAWRYNYTLSDMEANTEFTLSDDFNPVPIGADWMRLVTEWYQGGIIPRSVFISIAKQNDIIPTEYDDAEGISEIGNDTLIPGIETKGISIDGGINGSQTNNNTAPTNKPAGM